jgi:hypothetical protein
MTTIVSNNVASDFSQKCMQITGDCFNEIEGIADWLVEDIMTHDDWFPLSSVDDIPDSFYKDETTSSKKRPSLDTFEDCVVCGRDSENVCPHCEATFCSNTKCVCIPWDMSSACGFPIPVFHMINGNMAMGLAKHFEAGVDTVCVKCYEEVYFYVSDLNYKTHGMPLPLPKKPRYVTPRKKEEKVDVFCKETGKLLTSGRRLYTCDKACLNKENSSRQYAPSYTSIFGIMRHISREHGENEIKILNSVKTYKQMTQTERDSYKCILKLGRSGGVCCLKDNTHFEGVENNVYEAIKLINHIYVKYSVSTVHLTSLGKAYKVLRKRIKNPEAKKAITYTY